MRRDYNSVHGDRHLRHPNLPDRSQDERSFRERIPFPIDSEEDFANRHAGLYGDEEHLVDGRHPGSAHFPSRSERAIINAEYTSSNRPRDRTRNAYNDVLDPAIAEY